MNIGESNNEFSATLDKPVKRCKGNEASLLARVVLDSI